jgi:hypothetical protein
VATPTHLVTLAELAGEGFGYDSPNVPTPRDSVGSLATRLNGDVVRDDPGRRCVTRETARRLFDERNQAERRQREAQERRDAEFAEEAAANRPWAGIPAEWIPDGVAPASAMLQAAKDAQPRRRSVLEHALANDGAIEYMGLGRPPEP